MKSSLLAMGLIGLATVGLWYLGGGTQSLPVARAGDSPRVASPLAHENLTVYFVHGPDTVPNARVMNLQEALERQLAVVHETGNVNTLAVENLSADYELFIQSGDIVKGGQQDRVAAIDMLLSPKSGIVPLPAHCVEHGRWSGRAGETAQRFQSSNNYLAGKNLKYANATFQQQGVWDGVQKEQGKLKQNTGASVNAPASPSSFQLTLESPVVKAKIAEYEAALKSTGENDADIIGVVFVVNGQVTGAEVYGSNALFRKAWPKLLSASAVEAVAEHTDKLTRPAPTAREVEYFLARSAEPESATGGSQPEPATSGSRNTESPYLALLRGMRNYNYYQVVDGTAHSNGEMFPSEVRLLNQAEGQLRAIQREGQQLVNPEPNPLRSQVANRDNPNSRISIPALGPLPLALDHTVTNPHGTQANSSDHRQVFQFSMGVFGSGDTVTPMPASLTNYTGNQLNSNRTENRSTLMVESRDPKRHNAIIHRSYIKK